MSRPLCWRQRPPRGSEVVANGHCNSTVGRREETCDHHPHTSHSNSHSPQSGQPASKYSQEIVDARPRSREAAEHAEREGTWCERRSAGVCMTALKRPVDTPRVHLAMQVWDNLYCKATHLVHVDTFSSECQLLLLRPRSALLEVRRRQHTVI